MTAHLDIPDTPSRQGEFLADLEEIERAIDDGTAWLDRYAPVRDGPEQKGFVAFLRGLKRHVDEMRQNYTKTVHSAASGYAINLCDEISESLNDFLYRPDRSLSEIKMGDEWRLYVFLKPLRDAIEALAAEARDEASEVSDGEGEALATSPASTDIFRRDGRDWFMRFCGKEALCTHVEGFAICHDLLHTPNSYIEAQELPSTRKTDLQADDFGADEVIDEQAERELKEKARVLAEEISQARQQDNDALVEQKLGELEKIENVLRSAKNIHGKRRTLNSTASEKSRKRVWAALDLAYEKLRDKGMGELADHLHEHVDVDGSSYAYRPTKPIDWCFDKLS